MSIIERLADLLGPVVHPQQKPAEAGDVADTPDPGLIERAVNDGGPQPDVPRDDGLEAQSQTRARSARPKGTVNGILRIDPDRLRRQNIITPDGERTQVAESFRRIKRHVLGNLGDSEPGTSANLVMVTSPLAGEGKTFCSINLAISIAMEMDRTVLLVDADVAKPLIPAVLGVEAKRGLMDVLLDRNIDLAHVLRKTDIDTLTLLPAGTGHRNATELLASEMMRQLLQAMASRYHDRIIIFDSPPLLVASEAAVLANRMGQIIMVVEAGKTTATALKVALGRIESSKNVGLLLNKGQASGLSYYYGGYGV